MRRSIDLTTHVGTVTLRSPILTASGTAGHGDELAGYGELSQLGAVVSKSLASFAWPGNAAPRVSPAGISMINSVGLAGPGVKAWRETDLPALLSRGATVIGSIWGRTISEFADAAAAMAGAQIAALEVNVSCPNLEDRSAMFAHSAEATAAVVTASAVAGVPLWVKLSPTTPQLVEVAEAAERAGASALVVANTLTGLYLDIETGRATLGRGGGGVSGVEIFPVALRAVYDVCAALPATPVVGVGGVRSARDVVAMLMAGAHAVEIGTAALARPRALWRIQRDLARWMAAHQTSQITDIVGRAHGPEFR